MSESTRKSSKLNVLQHIETAFTKCHIVSTAPSKTGIVGTLQHYPLLIAMRTMAADARSLGRARYYFSEAKDDENKKLQFEEIAKGKYERNRVCFTMKTTDESFCAPLHL